MTRIERPTDSVLGDGRGLWLAVFGLVMLALTAAFLLFNPFDAGEHSTGVDTRPPAPADTTAGGDTNRNAIDSAR